MTRQSFGRAGHALLAATAAVLLLGQPAAAQNAPAARPPGEPAYRINPGDQLEIYVWGDERLQRVLSVLPDGSLAFPLAGTIQASGHTPPEVEQMLSKLLASQYRGQAPQVTVSVRAPSGMQISVIGKVRAPGTFSPTRYVSVLDALALAGGPTDFADVGNIVILRRAAGRTVTVRSRLSSVLKGRPSGSDLSAEGIPQLVAGDTVVVP